MFTKGHDCEFSQIRIRPPKFLNHLKSMKTDETQAQLVVKKSIVFDGSKNGKKEPPPYALKPKVVTKDGTVCLQSISVPPQNHVKIEVPPPLPPPMRGRSKERRSKDRQHCKKNHKSRKKNKEGK
ncbi:hypothetical protein TNIN_362851 [Trichonephila inaurata madagascariensis]|uniref:Uncharacterized protein n=1 Tax=Trichonephila inaurata madagascariensis TaxID=2747483 RepID=A0A8X6YLG4_9ARAC|nr:hypothetical protein TNIN_362851 [Trichonephila inaurata madagascariensis]